MVVLAVAVVLAAGALTALRVQFRGEAQRWEDVLIWASLGLGVAAVAFSLVLNLPATSEITPSVETPNRSGGFSSGPPRRNHNVPEGTAG